MAANNLWIIGVILILVGSVGQNFGNNLVSLAHSHIHDADNDAQKEDKEDKVKDIDAIESTLEGVEMKETKVKTEESDDEVSVISEVDADGNKKLTEKQKKANDLWRYGTIIFVTGSLTTFASFGFAAQSLLASLESVQFVSNMVFAKLVHGEEVTNSMLCSTFMICVGNLLVVMFSDHAPSVLTGDEILDLFLQNTAFHIYVVFGVCFFIFAEYTFRTYNEARNRGEKLWRHAFIEPCTFAMSSAIVGALATTWAKCMSMLLADPEAGFTTPHLYIIFFTWVGLVGWWIGRLDRGLGLFPPLFIIPVIQVFFVFFSIMVGGIFFEEFLTFDTEQFIGFFSGVTIILGGVYGLAPSNEIEEVERPAEIEKVETRERQESTASNQSSDNHKPFSSIDGIDTADSNTKFSIVANDMQPKEIVRTMSFKVEGRSRRQSVSPLAAILETQRRANENPTIQTVQRKARRLSSIVSSTVSDTIEGTGKAIRRLSLNPSNDDNVNVGIEEAARIAAAEHYSRVSLDTNEDRADETV